MILQRFAIRNETLCMHMYKDNLLFHNSFVNQIGLTGKFCGRACTIFSVLLTITVLGTSSLSSPGHVSLIGNFPPLSLSQPLCLILTFDTIVIPSGDRSQKLSLSRQMSCPGFGPTNDHV